MSPGQSSVDEPPLPLTTPPASTDRGLTPPSPHPRRKPDRSCVLCHRRKIRCDRQTPCLACVRARLTCTYPVSDKPIRRVRKATIADVASRISDLEKTIVAASIDHANPARRSLSANAYANTHVPAPVGLPVSLPVSPHESPREPQELPSEEVLIRNGTSSQYFNELLISKVIEEDQDKSSLLHTPHNDSKELGLDSPFSLIGLLSSPPVFEEKEKGWRLSRLSATQLWHLFVQNVDATMKLLHIPTDEVTIFTAIHQPESVASDVLALVSAMYFATTVTLELDEAQHVLGVDKSTALRTFKRDFQMHLSRADMLENPTVVLLQGLAIYLASARAYYHGRGIWILNGLAVRMAHSIGLHRDGTKLGMSPFESEIRRRLWWHFLARDSRAAEDHGISSWSTVPSYDTKLPLNVDDSELRPDMRELPPPHNGWTKMSLPLTCMEVAQTLQHMANLSMTPSGSTPKEVIRSNMLNQLRSRVEQYIKPCNPVIPVQRMTMKTALAMVHKIDFVTRQQLANMENPDKRNAFATEANLLSALRCLEIHLELWSDELLRPYRWCMYGHPQYHMLLYVLWHLCVCPTGPSVDRAWVIVAKTFELEQVRLSTAVSGPALKSVILKRLHKKAELIRQSVVNGNDVTIGVARADEVPDDNNMMNPPQEAILDVRRFDGENVDWSSLMQNTMPDWNTLVEDLHLDLHDFSSYF
ncbi:hypothetical protein MKX07_004087 [Trichoderma sp. CBMAI-0711]|uniref:Zn(2)-C6 fungal-type domain-containing protein n=1 Tax=Trichoderma parareesei TaxID=858221 RepID=A0A2H2ZKP1_TRIPA|nr:hypothetical protein MKX07_004087 [Trichoderma sp. CBMAI-0711]OTA07363.1 hypothetical protein A9Z42_0082540 [Trichoderma parareesei]